tara:strand:- start:421 stop:900 length:480 start_codon:yes stop_codon:yes gene_type:complete
MLDNKSRFSLFVALAALLMASPAPALSKVYSVGIDWYIGKENGQCVLVEFSGETRAAFARGKYEEGYRISLKPEVPLSRAWVQINLDVGTRGSGFVADRTDAGIYMTRPVSPSTITELIAYAKESGQDVHIRTSQADVAVDGSAFAHHWSILQDCLSEL